VAEVTSGRFTDALDKFVDVRYLNNGMYRVLTAFTYKWRGRDYTVPAGYESDGFTIPKWFRWALPKVPKRGLKASILHDYFVANPTPDIPREIADEIFGSALKYLDVKTRRVCIYYRAVRLYTRSLRLKGK